ncbi:hypothetical protein Enr13x_64450 [Stieleria neptunia]|uniref:Uncharacterized protein n=1 Tax=Stieleria neptunia TaxID=2527979 RepID=A0A518I095_9BACT|nr:hypothetical protein Enr13x_64450 [Stieleria neptunia]
MGRAAGGEFAVASNHAATTNTCDSRRAALPEFGFTCRPIDQQ